MNKPFNIIITKEWCLVDLKKLIQKNEGYRKSKKVVTLHGPRIISDILVFFISLLPPTGGHIFVTVHMRGTVPQTSL